MTGVNEKQFLRSFSLTSQNKYNISKCINKFPRNAVKKIMLHVQVPFLNVEIGEAMFKYVVNHKKS